MTPFDSSWYFWPSERMSWRSEAAYWAPLLSLALASACGDDITQGSTGSSTSSTGSTGVDSTSTDAPTGVDPTSTDTPLDTGTTTTDLPTEPVEPCSRIHEGKLYVNDDTDLPALADLGRVTGSVEIVMQQRDQRDLSFLGCLHTVDGVLNIAYNELLETTEGLANLRTARAFYVRENANLRVVTGLDQFRDTYGFDFHGNPLLEEVELVALETVYWMSFGRCSGTKPYGGHQALVDLSGFDALTRVDNIALDGNEALMSAGLFDALAANGAVEPLRVAVVRFNPVLPQADIQASLDVLVVPHQDVCGNAGGPPDPACFCVVGE